MILIVLHTMLVVLRMCTLWHRASRHTAIHALSGGSSPCAISPLLPPYPTALHGMCALACALALLLSSRKAPRPGREQAQVVDEIRGLERSGLGTR
mmetsp:Transcript_21123/g.57959  ORF Transcript_21123/g.57959 Transcript_21123/m.57959 type:complete len:96 (-) Transcript_21123:689-976(-)